MRLFGLVAVLLTVWCGASLGAVVEYRYPLREACMTGSCGDSMCVTWGPMGCLQWGLCPGEDRDDLWWVRLWAWPRSATTWTLVRQRRIAAGMAGQLDTLAVPSGFSQEATVAVTLVDSTGNESCKSNFVPLYGDTVDTRVGVDVIAQFPGAVIERYDLGGARHREPRSALPTGIYFERIRYRGQVWERKVVVIH